jgi:hypothetical protein
MTKLFYFLMIFNIKKEFVLLLTSSILTLQIVSTKTRALTKSFSTL